MFLIEFLNEQRISIRNIDGCYFLPVKEQTFLMLKLKPVRFALTTTSTEHSRAVCAARNAQQACSQLFRDIFYFHADVLVYTSPRRLFFRAWIRLFNYFSVLHAPTDQLTFRDFTVFCVLLVRSDLVWWLINSCSPFILNNVNFQYQNRQLLFVYS